MLPEWLQQLADQCAEEDRLQLGEVLDSISFNGRARKMDNTKRETIKATIAQGLASANKGNIFWTKADAMQSFAVFHKSAK